MDQIDHLGAATECIVPLRCVPFTHECDIKVEIPATPLEPPDRSTSALSAFIRVHLRPDVLFFRPNAKTKTPYWPQMNANERG